jgi:ribosomal-protein-alanine N-acetyltransferase
MSVLIRSMKPSDVDAVLSIAAGLPQAPQWQRVGYEAALESADTGRRVMLVAEAAAAEPAGSGLAGFAVASMVPPEAELESIGVDAGYQRRGIGRELLARIVGACRARGCREIILEVRASNDAAQALYRAAGFRPAGRRTGYYSFPAEDALIFRRELVSGEK